MRLLDGRLDLYRKCNYRCIFCGEQDKSEHPEFPLELMDVVFPVLNRYCWSVFLSCGGEPTLHPQFSHAMEKVGRLLRAPDVSMVTNGFNLTGDYCDAIIDAGVSRVFVSLHSAIPAVYARLTGTSENALEKVGNNVRMLVARRKNRPFPKVIVTSIVMKSTLDTLSETAQWAIDNGADAMNTQWLLCDYNPDMVKEQVTDDHETKRILNCVSRQLRTHRRLFYYPYSLGWKKVSSMIMDAGLVRNKAQYLTFLVHKYRDALRRNSCRVAGNTFILQNTGEVQLCHKNVTPLPNIFQNPGVDLYRVLKTAQKNLRISGSEPCRQGCPYFKED